VDTQYAATGRRKNAIARVTVTPGKGARTINGKSARDYFKSMALIKMCEMPLTSLEINEEYDIKANVKGGGLNGQSAAVRLGISRALAQVSDDYHRTLRHDNLLTVDARKVERKKYGKHGARRSPQFSKR
jgi:small subunit ribosomal protein S9